MKLLNQNRQARLPSGPMKRSGAYPRPALAVPAPHKPACACGGGCPRCTGLQFKLEASAPGDRSEHQADQVASRVSAGESLSASVGWERGAGASPSGAARACGTLPGPQEALRGGEPLDPGTRGFMEARIGHSFRDVRVHTGAEAQGSARAVGARAYTLGSDVVFGAGQYAPHTERGRRLLAHELAHVAQQSGAARPWLARQCDPAWSGLDWATRVTNAKGMAAGAASNQCLTDLIQEALGSLATVHQSTNTRPTTNAAITAGAYTELGTMVDRHINFDRNLTAKSGRANQYGEALYRTAADDSSISLYIILSPNALNATGPDFTRMTFEHELAHTDDYMLQWATGTPHAATAGEELAIYQQNFEGHFLDLMKIDGAACSWSMAEDFSSLFNYYPTADAAARDTMFDNMRIFHEVRIENIPCNATKYKIWFQAMLNARAAGDALAARINGLPGLGLTRGDPPTNHLTCPTTCA